MALVHGEQRVRELPPFPFVLLLSNILNILDTCAGTWRIAVHIHVLA
jgi:hypothetical protein